MIDMALEDPRRSAQVGVIPPSERFDLAVSLRP
jgi:hypothetical protein